MPHSNEHRIALFIDFENLVTNTGLTPANFDLQPSLDRLLEKGKVVFRRAYCDWARFREAKGRLHELGVELIDVPPSTRAGKNGADMRLVIDALELCYAREHIDTFVIASGDSDFCPLAYKLRENDRTVIGLGVREATSPLFVKACDEFIYLRPPAAPRAPARPEREREPTRAPPSVLPSAGAVAAPSPGPVSQARPPSGGGKQVPQIAREVVASLLRRATAPLNPSLIKETIVRKEPDFDERDHGFSTFSRLLEAMEREGLLRKQQQPNNRQWYVVSPESSPEAASAPAEAGVPPAAVPQTQGAEARSTEEKPEAGEEGQPTAQKRSRRRGRGGRRPAASEGAAATLAPSAPVAAPVAERVPAAVSAPVSAAAPRTETRLPAAETRPAPKAESRPAATESKPAVKAETRPAAKTAAKAAAKAESRPAAKTAAKAVPKTEARPAVKTVAKSAPKAKAASKSAAKPAAKEAAPAATTKRRASARKSSASDA